jgi:hypothetical protein
MKLRVINVQISEDFIVVSACDSSHFLYIYRLIESLSLRVGNFQIVLYDLGMTESQIDLIIQNFDIEIVKFNFSEYPKFVAELRNYSWKALVIYLTSLERRGVLLYLDARNNIIGDLDLLNRYVTKYGFVSNFTTGNISQFTDSCTLEEMKVAEEISSLRNLNAAFIGLNTNDKRIRNLLELWKSASLSEKAICPHGPRAIEKDSFYINHRFDQSLLSILAWEMKLVHNFFWTTSNQDFNVETHVELNSNAH